MKQLFETRKKLENTTKWNNYKNKVNKIGFQNRKLDRKTIYYIIFPIYIIIYRIIMRS